MKKISMSVFVFLTALLTQQCFAQQQQISLINNMDSPIDLIITPANGGKPQPFTLAVGQPLPYNFTQNLVSIQVVPKDEQDSGFPVQQIDLADYARRFPNVPLAIDGEKSDPTTKTVCCKRRFHLRCCCHTVTVPGERTAMLLKAGDTLLLRVPKMKYKGY